ncbi:MAG TPA: signal peptidase I [Candidatus Limnocylindrales bacterium]|nr:signal peptidase I [Candidatus Limnocylindrales bacterium]
MRESSSTADPGVIARSRTGARGWLTATLGAGAIALLLPLTTFLVAVWLMGWQLQSVLTGSMSPTYPIGSLLVVGQVDAGDVRAGMAITFEDPGQPGRLVTHRIVALSPSGELQFITRGDANSTADALPVPARLVRGRVLWSVASLGTVMEWLQWPRSFVLLVLVPTLLLAAIEVRNRSLARATGRGASLTAAS